MLATNLHLDRARSASCRRPFACLLLLLTATALGVTLFQVVRPALADSEKRAQERAGVPPTSSTAAAADAYGKLPLQFEANSGQTDERVRFIARGAGYNIFFTSDGAVLTLRDASAASAGRDALRSEQPDKLKAVYRVLRMRLEGAAATPETKGLEELPGKINYLIGNESSKWRTGVPLYSKVRYRGIYRGVDLVYYGNQRQLEYDFEVAPGADPRVVRLSLEGADSIKVGDEGDLVLTVAGGEVRMRRPLIYQVTDDGARREIRGRFVLKGKDSVGFEVEDYDASRQLVIDPVLSYATYLGSSSSEIGYGIAVDSLGSAYVTGSAGSLSFPVTGTTFTTDSFAGNAFVSKLNPSGTALVYSTLIGGGSNDTAYAVAASAAGEACITGRTTSTDFPTVNAFRANTSLIKSADGGASWRASNTGINGRIVSRIVVDPATPTNVYAIATSVLYKSVDGGATWGALNTGASHVGAFAIDPKTPTTLYAGLSLSGAAVIKSTDGGSSWSPAGNALSGPSVLSLAVDPQNSSIIYAGLLNGAFKSTDGGASWNSVGNGLGTNGVNSFAINPASTTTVYAATVGGVFKSTDGGGSWSHAGNSSSGSGEIVIDPSNPSTIYTLDTNGIEKTTDGGSSWIGVSASIHTTVSSIVIDPTSPSTLYAGAKGSGIYKTTNGGASAVWTPLYGGLSEPGVWSLAIGPSGAVYAGLNTNTSGGSNADGEAFVAKLNAAGDALVFSTYLGGDGEDEGDGVAFDGLGNVLVTGHTSSHNFAVFNARQPALNGATNAFVSKFAPSGEATYSTYLGGNDIDNGWAIAADSSGNAYVTGDTSSTNFPVTTGAFQTHFPGSTFFHSAFVTKLDSSGSSLAYSTYLGGNSSDTGRGIAVDTSGNAYITGSTISSNFPTVNPAQSAQGSAFVSKLNASGSALVYSTYLGGNGGDSARGIAVDANGGAYVTGISSSQDFPGTADAFKSRSGLFKSDDGGKSWSNINTAVNVMRVNDVTVDPSNASTVYAGTSSGVFKSTNSGRTWASTNTGLTYAEVVSVAVDPKTPTTLYAATTLLGTSTEVGLFKSTDGGLHWSSSSSGLATSAISDVVIDPATPTTVYASTASGIFKSTDSGATWVNVNNSIANAHSLAIDPTNPHVIYAANNASQGGVFKTTDAGATWFSVGNGLGTNPVAYVALDPSTPSTLYAATSAGIFKSTDAGATWTLKRADTAAGKFAIDPKSPSTIYLSTSFQGGSYVWKSIDGGSNWFPYGGGVSYPVLSLAVNPQNPTTVYAGANTFGTNDSEAFITKLTPAGNAFAYSTLLPGTQWGFGVAADQDGNAYVTGSTNAPGLPTTSGAYQSGYRGGDEVFVAKVAASFKIGGRVTDGGGNPQAGVRVTLSGTRSATQFTGADGTYEFANLAKGESFNVSATKTGFAFTPPQQSFNNLSADQTSDFTLTTSPAQFHTIGGRIAEADGTPVSGVAVSLTGSQTEFTTTDGDGRYAFSAPDGGNYVVTPSATAFNFSPLSQSVNNLGSDQSLNFTGNRQALVVTNTNDSGAGSLRQAILDANSIPGLDTVVFNIPGPGVKTIALGSDLPDVSNPLVIDGTTQPGFSGSPVIELVGTNGPNNNVLHLTAGASVVRALVINRAGFAGIRMDGNGGNVVEGCFIGTDVTGTLSRPNNTGIYIGGSNNNTIGGTTAAARNVISGNSFNGIESTGVGNIIRGNFIGTDAAGRSALSNGLHGIEMTGANGGGNTVGGASQGARNVISGNGHVGIEIRTAGNVVQGNFIGTDLTGTSKVPNLGNGVESSGANTQIGGTSPGEGNVISGNNGLGVSAGATGSRIQGNLIGTDATGTSPLGNGAGGAVGNFIGGTEPGSRNVISGNGGSGNVFLGSNSVVQGNYIGTDITGQTALVPNPPNFTVVYGISIQGGNNIVGGTTPAARNVISGNTIGISVSSLTTTQTDANVIQGNYIGVNADGSAPLPNSLQAINFSNTNGNTVGGDADGAGNLIAFNGAGVVVLTPSTKNSIRGNRIFSNNSLGIDLGGDGVTRNDLNDADTGANNLQNFPVITSVAASGGGTNVRGTLNSTPNTRFDINFYSNRGCGASGNGEGARPLSTTQVTTGADGNSSFDVTLPVQLDAGRAVTATATDPAGNTSEFSPCDASAASGRVEFAYANFNVLEDVGAATVRVVRTGGSSGTLTVNYSTVGGTATPGSDYTPVSGQFTFAAGETEKTFTIPIVNDGVNEPEETVGLLLSGTPDLESLGGKARATLHIFDSNTPLTILFDNLGSSSGLSFPEGDTGTKNAVVTLRLSAATSRTVTVDYDTVGGTQSGVATPGVDFLPVSGTLTFAPGTETQNVSIPIVGDTVNEFNELFDLELKNPSGATVTVQFVDITIVDDDPPPSVSVTDVTTVEGAKAVFSVRLSQPTGKGATVTYATADGTATAGSDYTATSGSLFFSPGQTVKTVEVPVLADAAAEPDETFFLNVASTNTTRATVADGQGQATIVDSSAMASLVRFSASSYSVNEPDGQAQITVTRTGDASKAASVDYKTVSQSASERSDYTASLGTLRFAPGETQKTFTVLITDDRFLEPAESLDLVLSNPVGAALGGPNVASLTIISDDTSDGTSPVGDAGFDTQFFVRQHYHDFLNREPDAAGLQFWVSNIDSCADAQCREVKKINTSAAFFLSIEFQETGYLVYRTYKAAYGDTTSPNVSVPVPVVKLQEFLSDSQRIGQDVQVGIGDWQAQLEANKQAYMVEFVQRQRFADAYPSTMTPAQFVDKLNQNSGGVLSQTERDQFVADLAASPDQTQGRANALRRVAEDDDMKRNESNRAFVLMQYFGYLRRNPDDAPDGDFRGWQFWLSKLDQFHGNFVQAEMVKAFISSDEYRHRFGQ